MGVTEYQVPFLRFRGLAAALRRHSNLESIWFHNVRFDELDRLNSEDVEAFFQCAVATIPTTTKSPALLTVRSFRDVSDTSRSHPLKRRYQILKLCFSLELRSATSPSLVLDAGSRRTAVYALAWYCMQARCSTIAASTLVDSRRSVKAWLANRDYKHFSLIPTRMPRRAPQPSARRRPRPWQRRVSSHFSSRRDKPSLPRT